MESLLENLSQFEVSSHPNNPNAEHPRYSLYKAKPSGSSQEERRKKILEARKIARYDFVKHLRQIEGDEEYDESVYDDDNMDIENPVTFYARPREYKNFVMLSEWLVDVPEDFSSTYIALPCPVGKRCLVVCYKGWTTAYAKNGARIRSFPSCLPGGSHKTKHKGYTVLDCIFSEINSTFYIIDLICWNRRPYIDCETNFRFTWLQSRISEWDEDLSSINKSNSYRFVVVPNFDCSINSLQEMLSIDLPLNGVLDGVLFYHKESHYTHGPSPLICWLKAFMMPEMLSVPIPVKYLHDRPANYTNVSTHILEFEKEREDLKAGRKNKRNSKDTKKGVRMQEIPNVSEAVVME